MYWKNPLECQIIALLFLKPIGPPLVSHVMRLLSSTTVVQFIIFKNFSGKPNKKVSPRCFINMTLHFQQWHKSLWVWTFLSSINQPYKGPWYYLNRDTSSDFQSPCYLFFSDTSSNLHRDHLTLKEHYVVTPQNPVHLWAYDPAEALGSKPMACVTCQVLMEVTKALGVCSSRGSGWCKWKQSFSGSF